MNRYRGILYTILSAVLFGAAPIFGRISFDGGSNGVNLAFLRAALSLPFLYAILRVQKVPIRVTPEILKKIIIVGFFGTALTGVTLCLSYNYVSVGMATTLHFIYPVLVTLGCVLFFKERLNLLKIIALVAGTGGILLFLEPGGTGSAFGMGLAVFSGLTYAFYIIYMDQSGLKNLYYFQLSFYLSLVTAPVAGIFGLLTGNLTFSLTPTAWLCSLLAALMTSVAAVSLFQVGVAKVGASTASILCTFEPITSVVLGVLVLNESLSPAKLLGCGAILTSVVLITLSERKKKAPASSQTVAP